MRLASSRRVRGRQRPALGRKPGHYEVYYLSVTDPASGVGLWIRYTMVAPLAGAGEEATCSLWLMAMDPAGGENGLVGRKRTWPAAELRARARTRSSCASPTRS